MYNWQAEFGKFAPELDVAVVTGTTAQRRQVRGERHEVYVTSYDLFRHDVRRWAGRPLWLVALDEVQCIKNHETLAARAVKALDARHRLALTGTSIENRLSELWNIFDFLMPGLLGATSASMSAMISPSRWATTTWRRTCGVRWAPSSFAASRRTCSPTCPRTWWNVAAQNQDMDRAHRIGQVRDVTVYKVIAHDTIEERILAL